jgi:hypothetical protein
MSQFSADEQDLISRLLSRMTFGEWHNYPGMPKPEHRTLADGPTVVNSLLLYWVQHGRIAIRPGIDRIAGQTVHFTDGTTADYDTILWATGFRPTLPFLDVALVPRRKGVPLRYAAGVVPKGLEKLYYIGMAAPRGPQISVYGVQAKLAIRMIALHEATPGGFAGVAAYLGELQEDEDRIDIVRAVWTQQLADTQRLLDAFATARVHELHTVGVPPTAAIV